jgi:TRAP-type C4-dicarboxylate transport system permease small subunit
MKKSVESVFRNLDTLGSCFALVVVILSVTYGVIMRYLFGDAPIWTSELSAIAFTWLVFLGASAAYKRKMHIGIDLLTKRLSGRAQWLVDLVVQLILLIFFGYMIVYGILFSIESYAQPTSIMRLPNTCFYLAVPVSFALMFLNQLSSLKARFIDRPKAS